MQIWEADGHSWASNTPKPNSARSQSDGAVNNRAAFLQHEEGEVWEMDCGGTDTPWFGVENHFILLVNHSMNTKHVQSTEGKHNWVYSWRESNHRVNYRRQHNSVWRMMTVSKH